MEQFFGILQRGLGQLDATGEYEEGTLHELKESYDLLEEKQQGDVLRIIEQSLKNLPDTVLIYIWSTLLAVLRDERVIPFIEVLMNHETFTLWQRAELMHQLQRTIFTNGLAVDEKDEYRRNDRIYNSIMDKIWEEKKKTFSYIPLAKRQKKVVIILNQLVGRQHAPTRIVLQTKEYLEAFGYEVKVYVGFMPNKNSGIMWYKQCIWNNFMEQQGYFKCNVENGQIEGYNVRIENDNFEKNVEETAELIYREAPEWVLEVGEETFLADICREFTTVVTRGCVKTIPVTNAPIIVLASDYTMEEEQRYQNWLKPYQQFVEVKHSIVGNAGVVEKEKKENYGIAEDRFVILLVGNRLEQEVTEDFLKVIYAMLEENSKAVLAVIGNCEALEKRIEEAYRERFYFLGYTEELQKTMTIGDLFLNPPRQGGGTGAMYAIFQEIPVVTLDNCDVQVNVGKTFICDSIDSMVNLVHQYCEDETFMEKRKEACRQKAEEIFAVDEKENYRRLCEFVETYTVEQEKQAQHLDGR